MAKNVTLLLEDGTRFNGQSFGYESPVAGEVVFNTAMMGYPESLTDPSYAGQIMTLTYPMVGNYGVPPCSVGDNGISDFMESDKIHATAIIVSDYSTEYSHWNAKESLAQWLKREKIAGVTGIDTRQLTKTLREHGVMMGKILFDDQPDNIPEADYEGVNFVDRVSCKTREPVPKDKIFDVMHEIDRAVCNAPLRIGDILIDDCAGTGIPVVATKGVETA